MRTLNDIEVKYATPAAGVSITDGGGVRLSSTGVKRTLRNLGEADALAIASMLPGFGSSGDYASGMSVKGNEYTHNAYLYDGATVFFPYRFGGIFSNFNPNHISAVEIAQMPKSVAPSVLGAYIQAKTTDSHAESVGGAVNVGLIASALTLRLPLTRSMSLTASARVSHLNYLYDRVLTNDDGDIRYGFADYNVTLIDNFDSNTRLKVSGLYSDDRLRFDDAGFLLSTHLKWRNAAATAVFSKEMERFTLNQSLSYSMFASRLGLDMPQFALALPSSVAQMALSGELDSRRHPYGIGYRVEYNSFEPQYSVNNGDEKGSGSQRGIDAWLFSLGLSRELRFCSVNTLRLKALVTFYTADGYNHVGLDRKISYVYASGHQSFTATMGFVSQYMHHVGFSDIGLASNFFLPSTKSLLPQESMSFDLGYVMGTADNRFSLSCNAYARSIFNASEYTADVINVMSQGYNAFDYVATGDGYDLGGDVMLRYALGGLSGWAGYSLNVARRNFYKLCDRWLPSAHEQLHSFKVMADYALGPRLRLSAYFVAASGRRYTPINNVYIVGGNVLVEYGERNSGHLPAYHRLDLAATYTLPCFTIGRKPVNSYINLSLINAYGHDNIEMQYYDYDNEHNVVQLRKIRSVYRLLPSLSYSLEF